MRTEDIGYMRALGRVHNVQAAPPEQSTPTAELKEKLQESYIALRRTNPTGVPGSLRKYATTIAPKLGYQWQDVLQQLQEDGVLIERAGSHQSGSKFNVRFA